MIVHLSQFYKNYSYKAFSKYNNQPRTSWFIQPRPLRESYFDRKYLM